MGGFFSPIFLIDSVSLLKNEKALLSVFLSLIFLEILSIFSRIFSAAGISNSGSSVNDTRIVSPIPSVSKVPMPNADFILPSSPSPASVTPK